MARYIYNTPVVVNTQNLSLSIDENLGILSTTYSGTMSSFAAAVGSYSTNTTLTYQNSNVLINNASTITLPSAPPNGTVYTFRNTSTSFPTLSAGTNTIRNVGSASGSATIQLVANGAYMLVYFNNVWYGI